MKILKYLTLLAFTVSFFSCSHKKKEIKSLEEEKEVVTASYIGEFRAGGVVFWIDPADNTYGLVCAIEDQDEPKWGWSEVFTGATGTAIGTGRTNTDAIIAAEGSGDDYAAGRARAYRGGGFDDWFLPSKDELWEMSIFNKAINVTAIANGGSKFVQITNYWSSTEDEDNESNAWSQFINDDAGIQFNEYKVWKNYMVRPIRIFGHKKNEITTDTEGKIVIELVEEISVSYESKAALEPITAAIGDFRAGGVVFWVDPADNKHGLVCAIVDQKYNAQWYNGSNLFTGATGTAIGTGTTNTDAIIAAQGSGDYAASIARAYRGGGFDDWFLPSKDELGEMCVNKAVIDSTATANSGRPFLKNPDYWSSTEVDSRKAWVQYFGSEFKGRYYKDDTDFVRAVRAF